jgi:transposase
MGRNNFCLWVGDNWASLLAGTTLINLENEEASEKRMVPALALATLLQFKEKLSDRQAEEASRLRVDWKYALHLSMYYPGLSRLLLCRYRQRVYHDPAWEQDFLSLLDRCNEGGLCQERQEPPLTAVAVLDEVCSQSRLEEAMLALRRVLAVLATDYPKWLRSIILPHWYTRYHLFTTVPDLPPDAHQQAELAETIGADILYLFQAISRSDRPELGEIEEILALRKCWREQFEPADAGRARRLPQCSYCGSFQTGGGLGE